MGQMRELPGDRVVSKSKIFVLTYKNKSFSKTKTSIKF